jgi:hypothetical protein
MRLPCRGEARLYSRLTRRRGPDVQVSFRGVAAVIAAGRVLRSPREPKETPGGARRERPRTRPQPIGADGGCGRPYPH